MDVKKPSEVLHFRKRADAFFLAAQALFTLDEAEFLPGVGLLAIHSAVALTDALVIATDGNRPNTENHATAPKQLRAWCDAQKEEPRGLEHLDWLIAKKTPFSYGAKHVKLDELKMAFRKLEQFQEWASHTFPEVVRLDGETDEA